MGDRSSAPSSWFETVVDESLRAFTTDSIAAEIRTQALRRAGLYHLPDEGEALSAFLREALFIEVEGRLGPEIAEAIVAHLGPLAEAARTGVVARGHLGSTDPDARPDRPTRVGSPLARLAPARWVVLATVDRTVVAAVIRATGTRAEIETVVTPAHLMVTAAAAKRRDSAMVFFIDGHAPALDAETFVAIVPRLPSRSHVVVRLGEMDLERPLALIHAAAIPCVSVESHASAALIASTCSALLNPSRRR